ncbi:MAG: GHKL domain-containing protein [Lachnospiraceae bacterium]|nr:GHKL domain-containing protein [Lachnospiraceae bacterium]
MNFRQWISALPQFFILLPAAVSCFLPAKNHIKYSNIKTALLAIFILVPFSFASPWICAWSNTEANALLCLSLVPLFFLYRSAVTLDLPRSLAIYAGVCAIETFPAQFAYSLDASLHPMSGAGSFSSEAALFQLFLSCLMLGIFAYPAWRYFSWAIDHLDFPKIWYSTVSLSLVFLIFNLLAVPRSYRTLQAGRLYYLFPLLEICALALLTVIYVLFYQGARLILKHTELKERSQLLELQSRQYRSLQEHMQQTARLRHDFRHSVRLLASLAEKKDLENIQSHLAEYELQLTEHAPVNYCSNAALNALLGYYREMADTAGIDTEWRIELPELLTVSELDLASLLGNVMENAIDGCRSLPNGPRYFCLTVQLIHGNRLYLVSTNNFNGKVRKGSDGYRSTKHNGTGTGLASITAVAEKYHGSARISNSEKEFFVDVILKL